CSPSELSHAALMRQAPMLQQTGRLGGRGECLVHKGIEKVAKSCGSCRLWQTSRFVWPPRLALGHSLRHRLRTPVKRMSDCVPLLNECLQPLRQLRLVGEVGDDQPLALQDAEPLLPLGSSTSNAPAGDGTRTAGAAPATPAPACPCACAGYPAPRG